MPSSRTLPIDATVIESPSFTRVTSTGSVRRIDPAKTSVARNFCTRTSIDQRVGDVEIGWSKRPTKAGSDTESDPVSDPRSDPGSDPRSDPGSDPWSEPGSDT